MTVSVYRIVNAQWLAQAFDGEAAKRYPGRWNSRGVPMVYTASSRALAMLEILAHFKAEDLLRAHFRIIEAVVPVKCISKRRGRWPKDWQAFPAPISARAIGDRWVRDDLSVAMAVPSALVPKEHNYLLNPHHPDFRRVVIKKPEWIEFDPRLTT